MQKLRSYSNGRLVDKNLPSLKSSVLTNKAMMAISKVDIDSRAIVRDKNSFILNVGEKDHQRSMSGLNQRRDMKKPIESSNKANFQLQSSNHFKLYMKDLKEQLTETQQTSNQGLMIDKSKISSKSYGIIKGYSANSHAGLLNTYNQDRICIVTNLNKTNIKSKQVSFFGIYDGNQGVNRADYMRDHFHGLLLLEELFWKDIEGAFRKVLRKINKSFSIDPRFSADSSTVAFSIVLIINEQMHYFQSGDCKSVVSMSLGEKISCPAYQLSEVISKQSSRKTKSVSELMKRGSLLKLGKLSEEPEKTNLIYKNYDILQENLDFILLGSEGVFENLKIKQIGRRVWLSILRNKRENIHFNIGEANNSLLSQVFNNISTKNASIIIIAFKSVVDCLEVEEELNLPYFDKEEKLPEFD